MKKQRVKAEDLARAVKVSAATVSLVLNGKDAGRVNPETRRRILKAAKALGYTIDRRARGLATGRSGMIGFVAPDIANPFFGLVHMALLKALGERYQVLVVATDIGKAAARHNIEQLLAIGIEAVVAVSVDGAFLDGLDPAVPMILVDSARTGPGVVSINYAVEAGAEALAAHLLSLGHRHFVYLDGDTPSRIFAARRDALVAAMRASGARPPLIARSSVDIAAAARIAARACRKWLASGATAIVSATDIQAYGVLSALRAAAVAVPETISMASFDDLPLSTAVAPPLTSVEVPAGELGRILARELLASLAAPDRPDPRILIPVSLHIRQSTGRAR
jgi:LacI family transcriptional regulator